MCVLQTDINSGENRSLFLNEFVSLRVNFENCSAGEAFLTFFGKNLNFES